jgi:hypothetical protein
MLPQTKFSFRLLHIAWDLGNRCVNSDKLLPCDRPKLECFKWQTNYSGLQSFDTILDLIPSFIHFNYTCNGGTQKPMSLNILDQDDCCIYHLI